MHMDLEQEKDRVDFITEAIIGNDFLRFVTEIVFFDEKKRNMPLSMVYNEWKDRISKKEMIVPWSLGTIVGCMYCGILLAKENWFDLLPDVEMTDLDEKFGFSEVEYAFPQKPNPKLPQVIRRIRNALGHGNIDVYVPEGIEYKELADTVMYTFRDQNQSHPEDTFEIKMSIAQIEKFMKEYLRIIHTHVKEKSA